MGQYLYSAIEIDKNGSPVFKGQTLRGGQSVECMINGQYMQGHLQYDVDRGWMFHTRFTAKGLSMRTEDTGDGVKIVV